MSEEFNHKGLADWQAQRERHNHQHACLAAIDSIGGDPATVGELVAVVRRFAAIEPSSFFMPDGSECERYHVLLCTPADDADFNGSDLAAVRAVLAKIPEEEK